jgi:hypothetical protein
MDNGKFILKEILIFTRVKILVFYTLAFWRNNSNFKKTKSI